MATRAIFLKRCKNSGCNMTAFPLQDVMWPLIYSCSESNIPIILLKCLYKCHVMRRFVLCHVTFKGDKIGLCPVAQDATLRGRNNFSQAYFSYWCVSTGLKFKKLYFILVLEKWFTSLKECDISVKDGCRSTAQWAISCSAQPVHF